MKTRLMKRLWMVALLGLLMLAVIPAAAQDVDLSQSYTFDDGTTFQYPDGWELSHKKTDDFVTLTSNHTRVVIPNAGQLSDILIDESTSLFDAMRLYFESVYQSTLKFDATNIESISVDDRDALRYDYGDPSGAGGVIIVIRRTDELIGVVDAVSLDGALDEADEVLAIAGSLQMGTPDAASGGHSDSGGAAAASGDDSESATPCTISTEDANTVAIRVGPGTNRTSFAFLPVGEDFEVIGKAEANDGSLWWKVDRAAVAPKKSAAEAWIAQDDVAASGGCDAVVDVNAPPVIPIVSAPPAPSGGGGDSGSTGGDSGQPAAAGSGEITPQTGRYTITYPSTVPGSCLGGPTQNIPFNASPDSISLTNVTASSLNFGGDALNRVQPNTYQGLLDLVDVSVLTTVRVYSTTTMTAEFILTGSSNGTQCSITITGTMTHN